MKKLSFLILSLCLCNSSCDKPPPKPLANVEIENVTAKQDYPQYVKKARATIEPLSGHGVHGVVLFEEVQGGVRVIAEIDGLTKGLHGFHVHEHGVCQGDGTSAGAHFNPTKEDHGSPEGQHRHVGDLGNLVANEQGYAKYNRVDAKIRLNGPNSIIGKSLIIHEKADDFTTQPTGDSGGRVACGVIQAD